MNQGRCEAKLVTDVNCSWSMDQAHALLPEMKALGLYWVEEPIWPPEDHDALAALRAEHGVALASGENLCTASGFKGIVNAVDFVQPSVTKVGGISEYRDVQAMAAAAGKEIMPHCPYFGPGYWASAQLMATSEDGMFEHLYIAPDAYPSGTVPLPVDGHITLPDRPGLGFEPEEAVLRRYAVEA